MPTLFITENTMASKDNKCKYDDNHCEEGEAEKSIKTLKKHRMSGDDNGDSSSTDDISSEEEVSFEEETIR
jgi:hypothetical protein